jgi:hypothetical protein
VAAGGGGVTVGARTGVSSAGWKSSRTAEFAGILARTAAVLSRTAAPTSAAMWPSCPHMWARPSDVERYGSTGFCREGRAIRSEPCDEA